MKRPPQITYCQSFPTETRDFILEKARESIAQRGIFRIALSGGTSPAPVYRELVSAKTDWSKWEVTFGDERCVPPDSSESNYRMAAENLLNHVPLPPENILRMRGEDPPEKAATTYEKELLARASGGTYRHDLILLGIGDDGHTASLFPGTDALTVTDRLVVSNYVPKFDAFRITFTYPLINASSEVCFMTRYPSKKILLEGIFEGRSRLRPYPCESVAPLNGGVTWMLDCT